jgi:hypothetical protein
MTMRTTFVFGAGASHHAGYPLAATMGEALLDFMLAYPNQPYPNFAQSLIDTFGKSPDIEDLITAIRVRSKFSMNGWRGSHLRILHLAGSRRLFIVQGQR